MKKLIFLSTFFLFTLSTFSQRFQVDTIAMTGSPDDRINLVFLSDGYQEHELDKFITDVNWMLDAILKKAPYSSYQNYFNAFAIKVPSEVSGAANDPDSLINNYFGSTFNWAGIWRLVVPARTSKIQDVLRLNFPQYDQVFMLVNDSRYGGSGGWIATNTTHSNGPEICIHEMGHSFAGLRDEYWAGPQYAREGINMTQETDPEQVKWAEWMGYNSTGIYPHEESPTWYRPHQNCEMRYLNRNFCPVCQEAIATTILNLTSPLISWSPSENVFTNADDSIDFSVQLLEPDPNTLHLTWTLNGTAVASDTDSIRLTASQLQATNNQLLLNILDTTRYIRDAAHPQLHSHNITWTFDSSANGILDIKQTGIHIQVFPNPATDHLTIDFTSNQTGWHQINLIDMQGKQWILKDKNNHISGSNRITINLLELPVSRGNYVVEIKSDQGSHSLPIVIN